MHHKRLDLRRVEKKSVILLDIELQQRKRKYEQNAP